MKKTLIKLTLIGVIGSILFTGCTSEEKAQPKQVTKQDFLEHIIIRGKAINNLNSQIAGVKGTYKIVDIQETSTKETAVADKTRIDSDISFKLKNITNSYICALYNKKTRTIKFTQEKSENACTSQENSLLIAEPNGLFHRFDKKNKKRIVHSLIDKVKYLDYQMVMWIENKQKFEDLKASNPQK